MYETVCAGSTSPTYCHMQLWGRWYSCSEYTEVSLNSEANCSAQSRILYHEESANRFCWSSLNGVSELRMMHLQLLIVLVMVRLLPEIK